MGGPAHERPLWADLWTKSGPELGIPGTKTRNPPPAEGWRGDTGAGKTPWKHNKNESLDDEDAVALQWILKKPLKILDFQ